MGPKRRIALVVVAVTVGVATLLGVAQAFPQNGGTETTQLNMPANGQGAAMTDQLPASVTQGAITVQPISDAYFFGRLRAVLGGPYHENFSDRALHCILITEDVSKNPDYFPGYQIKGKTLQVLFLYACLELALEVSVQNGAQARAQPAAAAGCLIEPTVAAIKISRSGSGYSATVTAAPQTPKARTTVRLSCQATSKGLAIKIKPRKRGQTLQSAIGPMLQIGFVNPTTAPLRLNIAFTATR
jgi:hypothetical protein